MTTVYEVYGMRWAGYMDCDSRSYPIAFFASRGEARRYLRKTGRPAEGIIVWTVYSLADEVLKQEKEGAREKKKAGTGKVLRGRRKGLVKK
jgi:hypothetical protein